MSYKMVSIVIDKSLRSLCKRPYYNHARGCPNYNKKDGCPPKALHIENVLDLSNPIYCIFNKFDFKSHVDKMRGRHPEWSIRQLECCLYWQGTARKKLKSEITNFKEKHPALKIVMCPEACGVNITETMRLINIDLEWPPKTVTYQVVLAGTEYKIELLQ